MLIETSSQFDAIEKRLSMARTYHNHRPQTSNGAVTVEKKLQTNKDTHT